MWCVWLWLDGKTKKVKKQGPNGKRDEAVGLLDKC